MENRLGLGDAATVLGRWAPLCCQRSAWEGGKLRGAPRSVHREVLKMQRWASSLSDRNHNANRGFFRRVFIIAVAHSSFPVLLFCNPNVSA